MIQNETKYTTLHGIKIAYTDEGQGTTFVFVHGFGTNADTWQYVRKQFSETYRMITYDLKGFGSSEKPDDEDYSAFEQANILAAFINTLELDNVTIVGHSFGGFIALLAALTETITKRVAGLVLISSVGYYTKTPEFIISLKVPILSKLLLNKVDIKAVTRLVMKKVFYNDMIVPEELVNAYADALHTDEAKKSFIKSAEQFSLDNLKRAHQKFHLISVPTLLIWGVDDEVVSIKDAYRFKHDIPNARLVAVPECGHSPQEECPQEVASFIKAFIQKDA